jgi:transcriptional regulator with XRE-family HTH domain
MKTIGVTLKSLRVERGYTLRQLAEKAEVPFSYLSNIENGKSMPGLDVIDRICFALGVPVRDIIIKTELDKSLKTEKKKLYSELMPYFRKIDAVAKQIYGISGNDSDGRDDDRRKDGEGIKPIIQGGGRNSNTVNNRSNI